MIKAHHSITIVGWDIDSRCRLVGPGGASHDGLPAELAPFLKALCERNPKLRINLLLWDFSTLYALERESFPRAKLAWERATLVLDDCLPIGSSQHQKLVIIDNSVAFTGGLDLTIRRWDTARHRARDPLRVDPAGEPYDPFHDVQVAIDGDAATAIDELASQRWHSATGETLPSSALTDVWPEGLSEDFKSIDIGISRTMPMNGNCPEIREVEHLFLDMIDAAENSIYIENQYLTSGLIAERLARQLAQKPNLNVLILAPRSHDPWLEALTMRNGRIRFRKILETAGAPERVRIAYPRVRDGFTSKAVFIHSKIMIVDDRIARIGSANLNNRSMGADSECDLVIEAKSEAERAAIARLRNQLIAMHCGMPADKITRVLASTPLVEASRRLSARGRSLDDIAHDEPDAAEYASYLEKIADPERPIDEMTFLAMANAETDPDVRMRSARWVAMIALGLLALAGGWTYATQDMDGLVVSLYQDSASSNGAFLAVLAIFVAGGFLLVPVTLLIVGTAAAFGLGWGLLYATVGTIASAALSYVLGAWLGQRAVRRMLGGKLLRVRNAVARRGVLAIAAIRMIPVAPFTVVNLAAGATNIGFVPYIAGTIIGMAPGFFVLSTLGHSLYRLVSEPTLMSLVAIVGALLLWLASVLALQHWVKRPNLNPP
jgi:phosphatidylserine/phosphatidylglycerophosphate/cardiolipin synthase-like enzyme/uncharacterized membrane protein YdjX (TVP38/TMEM64 family)